MIAIFSLIATLTLSLLITRIAAMALMLTGLSRESARFQARSAFSGVGFTTIEAESIVNHPVRRRIVMMLMLLGNIGVATVAATVMISLMQTSKSQAWWLNLTFLFAGMIILWLGARSRWIERWLNRYISYALRRWAQLNVRDYVAILQLQNGYAVSEMRVESQDWLAAKTLAELKLPDEGVLVLGIQRVGGIYIGTPGADTQIHAKDNLVLYGPIQRLEELDRRKGGYRGDKAHQKAIVELEEILEEQQEQEELAQVKRVQEDRSEED